MMLGSHLDAYIIGKTYRHIIITSPFLVIKYLGGYEFSMQNCWSLFFPLFRAALFEPITY